jgi:hypothetical protein
VGYYQSAYVMFGAEIVTEKPYRLSEKLESERAREILHQHDVGYSLSGPYDNDFLFLCKHHQEVELGEYKKLIHPDSHSAADDRLAIITAAQELGLSLVHEPTWLAVADFS